MSREMPKIKIPKELSALVREGREFETLIRQPAWSKLLDRMEIRVNAALVAMRESRSNDLKVQSSLMSTWKAAQTWLDFMQEQALLPVKRKQEAEEEIKSIIRMEMGEISEDREKEMTKQGVMPGAAAGWEFEEEE